MKALLLLFTASACFFPVMADNIRHTGKNIISAKKIAMIIALDNFRDEELLTPLNALRKAGFKVTVFSKTTKQAKGMLGYKFTPDKKLSELDVKNFDVIIFVGGSGAKVYWSDNFCHQICKTGKSVTIDGNIITANGPKASKEFAATIISKLKSSK